MSDLVTQAPDLSEVPLDKLGETPLAKSIELYRKRLRETGVPLSSFNARI